MVMDSKALEEHWNRVLADEDLDVIEKGNCILSEYIFLSNGRAVRLARAEAWLSKYTPEKLEKIRKGAHRGSPNDMHKRAIELYVKNKSVRKAADALNKEGHQIRFQGVAKILNRYLGE